MSTATPSQIGKGLAGTVYLVDSLWHWFNQLKHDHGDNVHVHYGALTVDVPAAFKVMSDSQRAAAEREVEMHRGLVAEQQKRGWRIVPHLYGYLTITRNNVTQHVICMEHVQGQSLSATRAFTQSVYDKLSSLYYKLWQCGYVHGDPHKGNVMVVPDGELMLIDMALAGRSAPRSSRP